MTIFDAIASSYIREDAHWGADLDVVKDSIDEQLARGRNDVRYIDVGCGPGFHIAFIKRYYPEICVTGIDPSTQMLKEARAEIRRFELKDVALIQTDIGGFWNPVSYHVVSFLNNSLGNVRTENEEAAITRIKVLGKLRSLVQKSGHVIVSVYNVEKYSHVYGPNSRAREASVGGYGNFIIEYTPPGGRLVEFYSHWFTEKELAELLEGNGFKIELLEERMARLVVRARAV